LINGKQHNDNNHGIAKGRVQSRAERRLAVGLTLRVSYDFSQQGTVASRAEQAGGPFEEIVVASGLGRVADVRPADFDGDGDLDFAVGPGPLVGLAAERGEAADAAFGR